MIVPASTAHAAAMAAIHARAFPDAPWGVESFETLLAQPGVFGFIEESGGMVLWRIAADEAEILTIGVTEARRGVGSALMRAALAQARGMGAAKMFLEVAAENDAARGLYESLGFAQAGTRPSYYADGGDAMLLSLTL